MDFHFTLEKKVAFRAAVRESVEQANHSQFIEEEEMDASLSVSAQFCLIYRV